MTDATIITTNKDLPQSIGVYCRNCLKGWKNCLCRQHDWMAMKEYVEAPG